MEFPGGMHPHAGLGMPLACPALGARGNSAGSAPPCAVAVAVVCGLHYLCGNSRNAPAVRLGGGESEPLGVFEKSKY